MQRRSFIRGTLAMAAAVVTAPLARHLPLTAEGAPPIMATTISSAEFQASFGNRVTLQSWLAYKARFQNPYRYAFEPLDRAHVIEQIGRMARQAEVEKTKAVLSVLIDGD